VGTRQAQTQARAGRRQSGQVGRDSGSDIVVHRSWFHGPAGRASTGNRPGWLEKPELQCSKIHAAVPAPGQCLKNIFPDFVIKYSVALHIKNNATIIGQFFDPAIRFVKRRAAVIPRSGGKVAMCICSMGRIACVARPSPCSDALTPGTSACVAIHCLTSRSAHADTADLPA
jgi:hypothetical protein